MSPSNVYNTTRTANIIHGNRLFAYPTARLMLLLKLGGYAWKAYTRNVLSKEGKVYLVLNSTSPALLATSLYLQ